MAPHPLLDIASTEESPEAYLTRVGEIFAVFGELTQDSGNISYGVRAGEQRFFVKTAGLPNNPRNSPHPERVELLRNAARLAQGREHPALPNLRAVIESRDGPMLVYEWVDGELLRGNLPRFRGLPTEEILVALDTIFEAHRRLAKSGWVACDFYDGSLIYDYERQQIHLMDLDSYHTGPFVNTMGRLWGSSHFMAPEEFQLGATIDERTNVFTMGRTISMLLSDGSLSREAFPSTDRLFEVMSQASSDDRERRHDSMASFCAAWSRARLTGDPNK